MERQEQITQIKKLLAHIDARTNVDAGGLRRNPTSVYVDADVAAREWDAFFRGHPHLIGLSGDLPEPGSFVTVDDLGVPILATRDTDGTFRAMVNSCRHRGAIVETDERGTRRRFTCGFHAWVYDTAGTLVGLPRRDHFGDVDTGCHGLTTLPAVERDGLLWVHPDPDGVIDLDELLPDDLAAELASWGFASLEYLDRDAYTVDCNWKLAIDTFGETYHFGALHADSLNLFFRGNVQCYDTYGRHHRMLLTRRAIDEMRQLPEDEWDITTAALPVYYLFPNVQLMPTSNGAYLVRVYPDPERPGRHTSRITFYVHGGAERPGPDDEYDRYVTGRAQRGIPVDVELERTVAQAFAEIIRDEDYAMSASQQRSAEAGTLPYAVFGRNEPALHHYHNTYRAALGMELLPLLDEADVAG